ncbi:MAG: hypothetical protein AAF329_05685 [Cyanobacteria bacterium P01_A01_bin.17]
MNYNDLFTYNDFYRTADALAAQGTAVHPGKVQELRDAWDSFAAASGLPTTDQSFWLIEDRVTQAESACGRIEYPVTMSFAEVDLATQALIEAGTVTYGNLGMAMATLANELVQLEPLPEQDLTFTGHEAALLVSGLHIAALMPSTPRQTSIDARQLAAEFNALMPGEEIAA